MNVEKIKTMLDEQIKDLEILFKSIPAEKRTEWELCLKLKSNCWEVQRELEK